MTRYQQHATGFSLSLLFHGAILASLFIGQMGMQSAPNEATTLPLSLAMFHSEASTSKTATIEAATTETAKTKEVKNNHPQATKPEPESEPEPAKKPTQETTTQNLASKPSSTVPEETIAKETITKKAIAEKTRTEENNEHKEDKTEEDEPASVSQAASLAASPSGMANQATTDHGIIKSLEAEYMAALRSAIEEKKHYPKRARRLKREGDVIIDFVINRNGQINNVRIRHSSGTQLLDKAALDAIKRLGQFKPIPAEIPRNNWALELPIKYALM